MEKNSKKILVGEPAHKNIKIMDKSDKIQGLTSFFMLVPVIFCYGIIGREKGILKGIQAGGGI